MNVAIFTEAFGTLDVEYELKGKVYTAKLSFPADLSADDVESLTRQIQSQLNRAIEHKRSVDSESQS